MMDHLNDGVLQALLDGELREADELTARTHLDACRQCAASYEEVQASSNTLTTALAMLDPDLRSTDRAPRPTRAFLPPVRWQRGAWIAGGWSRAAVLLLSVAAAASATIPGSPVRNWLGTSFRPTATATLENIERPVAEASVAPAPAEIPAPAEMGVRVAPSAGRVRIVLTRPAPQIPIRATLTDSSRGWVTGIGNAASMTFQTGTGTVEVLDASADELRIEIPRSAAMASIEIDGRTYVVKDVDHLRLVTGPEDTVADELRFEVLP